MRKYITRSLLLICFFLVFPISANSGDRNDLKKLAEEVEMLRRQVDSLNRVIRIKDAFAKRNGTGVVDDKSFSSILDNWDMLKDIQVKSVKMTDLEKDIMTVDTILCIPFDDVVKKYVDIYTVVRKDNVETILMRYDKYKPIIRQVFSNFGVPLDFSVLCIVESACNPNAISPKGAAGLWQIMPPTAREYGLTVSGYIDDRYDVKLSTEAAAKILCTYYRQFGSWALALMAYNCGPGRLENVIGKCGSNLCYEKIYEFLPKETREYLPALVAAMYINSSFASN